MKHIEKFVKMICDKYPDTETTRILIEKTDCGYYELCQSFLDIALNAPKIKAEDGTLQGVFQHTDINAAKSKAIEFIMNNKITDFDSFFEVLDYAYPQAASPDDKRPKTGFVKEENCKYIGYIGTFYTFTQISDNIYQNIVDEVIKEISEK